MMMTLECLRRQNRVTISTISTIDAWKGGHQFASALIPVYGRSWCKNEPDARNPTLVTFTHSNP
jgi:hypothetical protein